MVEKDVKKDAGKMDNDKPKALAKEKEGPKLRGIVRILATDIPGEYKLSTGLRRIKGVSFMFANYVLKTVSIDPATQVGFLSEDEILKIEETITKQKAPKWMLNRRNDPTTGIDAHLIGPKIDLTKREDINTLRRVRSYRGIRHEQGLPSRGQRTRGSFRKNKTVGVTKKKAQPAKKGGN